MRSWTNLRIITWDLDGTLYPFDHTFDQLIKHSLTETVALQLNCTPDEARKKFAAVKKEVGSSTKALEKLGLDGENFFIDLWHKTDLSQFIKPNLSLVTAFKNNSAYLHCLHTNSNTLETITKKLDLIGLESGFFHTIWTSGSMGYHKPDSEAFEVILTETETEPTQILYVGDRESVDILPAHELGMKTTKILNSLNETEPTVADAVAKSAEEVLFSLP